MAKAVGFRNGQMGEFEEDEFDYSLLNHEQQFGSHVNAIPIQSAVQGPRLFYGARFYNQAMPLKEREAPLVQNLDTTDEDGKSFDEKFGRYAGAVYADAEGQVVDVTPDYVMYKTPEGETLKKSLYNNFAYNRKCVKGNTPIVIKKQNGDLLRCDIQDYRFEEGDMTVSIDPVTYMSSWQPVTAWYKHPANGRKMVTVTTKSGRSLSTTADHLFFSVGSDGNLSTRQAQNLIPGKSRCPLTSIPLAADNSEFSYEDGVLAGLYLSEGWISPSRKGHETKFKLSIAVEPEVRRHYVRQLVTKVTGKSVCNSKGRVVCYFTELCDSLVIDFGKGAADKYIADHVFSRGKEYLSGLVAGYFNGDGCLHKDTYENIQLEGWTTSEKLRNGLVDVLRCLGVIPTLRFSVRNSEKWKDAYGFRIPNIFLNALHWFTYPDRVEKFNSLVKASYRSSSLELIPLPEDYDSLIYAGSPVKNVRVYDAVHARKISKRDAKLLTTPLKKWGESDVLWDEIVSVSEAPKEDYVYDLTVANSSAFAVCNGLLIHNSGITNYAKVKPGDVLKPGTLLAASNYTDDQGVLAIGKNARVGVVPYKGYSMDDAIVLRQGYANSLISEHMETHEQEFDKDVKPGLNHFRALFPEKFTKHQLEKLDAQGVVKPGQILKEGDPLILATRPRVISSAGANVGKLTKSMSQARTNSSTVWESPYDAEVVDVHATPKGVKVVTRAYAPTKTGDKVTFRSGQKSVVSLLIPDEKMPHTKDGEPLDVLLNPLSLPSRTNDSLPYEIMLGKVAKKMGKPIKIPGFNKPGEKWYEYVLGKLEEAGVPDKEEVYDPDLGQWLENPILVGNAYMMKLHHTGSSKINARGQSGYDLFRQPAKGSGEGGRAKRLSGLETVVMLSSGAYNNLREGTTLRGQQNDEYWRALRMGLTPPRPGVPFAWDKVITTMTAAGINPRNAGKGILRLSPTTDKDVDDKKATEVTKGDLLNLNDLSPVRGGLFDPSLVGTNGWGKITLPFSIPNPAFEDSVRVLLGLKKKELDDVLAYRRSL